MLEEAVGQLEGPQHLGLREAEPGGLRGPGRRQQQGALVAVEHRHEAAEVRQSDEELGGVAPLKRLGALSCHIHIM